MNNLVFIQRVCEVEKLPMSFYIENGEACIVHGNHKYKAVTFDQCLAKIKESMAISFLDLKEMQ